MINEGINQMINRRNNMFCTISILETIFKSYYVVIVSMFLNIFCIFTQFKQKLLKNTE